MPVSTGTLPPPLYESPPRVAPHPMPAAGLYSLAATEPAAGGTEPLHRMLRGRVFCGKFVPRFHPFQATLETGENSPKFGARNDWPQPPRIVSGSIGFQLNPTFALQVPPKSSYWS